MIAKPTKEGGMQEISFPRTGTLMDFYDQYSNMLDEIGRLSGEVAVKTASVDVEFPFRIKTTEEYEAALVLEATEQEPDVFASLDLFSPISTYANKLAEKSGKNKNDTIVELNDIIRESQYDYDGFMRLLKNKYPENMPTAQEQKKIKQYIIRSRNDRKKRQLSYTIGYETKKQKVKPALFEIKTHDFNGSRAIEYAPLNAYESIAGEGNVVKIRDAVKKMKGKAGKSYGIILKPLDELRRGEGKKWLEGEEARMMTPDSWRYLEQQLQNKGMYLLGGKKDSGIIYAIKFHPEARDHKIGDLLSKLGKNSKRVYNEGIDEYLEQLGLSRSDPKQKEVAARAIARYEQMWKSNILYDRDLERVSIEELLNSGFITNAKDKNKRMSVDMTTDYPQREKDYIELLDEDGSFKYMIVEDIPTKGQSFVQGQKHGTYLELDEVTGKVNQRRNKADMDGGIIPHTSLFNKIIDVNGFESDIGFIKGSIFSALENMGVLRGKGAIHWGGPEYDALMDKHGVKFIVFKSAAKTVGNRKTARHKLFFKKDGTPYFRVLGKANVYSAKPEDIKINLGVTEDPYKTTADQAIVKPFYNMWTAELGFKDALGELMQTYILPSIRGNPESNTKIRAYLDNPTKENFNAIKDSDLRNMGDNTLGEELLFGPQKDSELARRFRKMLLYRGKRGEFIAEDIKTDEDIAFIDELNRMDYIMEAGDYGYTAQMEAGDVFKGLWRNYKTTKATKPIIPHSGKGYLILNDPVLMHKKGIKRGEIFFNMGWRDHEASSKKKYLFQGEEKTLKDIAKDYGDMLVLYAKSNKSEKLRLLKTLRAMDRDLELAVIRVPAPAVSGTRVLTLGGGWKRALARIKKGENPYDVLFTDKPGFGVLVHSKDKFYLDGADNDGDTVFFYQGLSKTIKDAIRKNHDQFEVVENGEKVFLPAKSAKFNKLFEAVEGDKHPASKYNPAALRDVAYGAFSGNKALGRIVTQKIGLTQMYSAILQKGKGDKVTLKTDEGKVIIEPASDNGMAFNRLGGEASSRSADAADYASQMSDSETIRHLTQSIFPSLSFQDVDGITRFAGVGMHFEKMVSSKNKGEASIVTKQLKDTSVGAVFDINNKLWGKNWNRNRRWTSTEIYDAFVKYAILGEEYDGSFYRLAQELASYPPYGYSKKFGTHSPLNYYNISTVKRLISTMSDVINKDTPEAKLDRDLINRFKLTIKPEYDFDDPTLASIQMVNDFKDVVGYSVLRWQGRKILRALDNDEAAAIDIVNDIADRVEVIKNARLEDIGEAQQYKIVYDINGKIRNDKIYLTEAAVGLGINPKVLTDYYDYYMLSPIFRQRTTFEEYKKGLDGLREQLKEVKDVKQRHQKEKIESLEGQIHEYIKDWHKTSSHRLGFETSQVSFRTKANYLKVMDKLLNLGQKEVSDKEVSNWVDSFMAKDPVIPDAKGEYGDSRGDALDVKEKLEANFEEAGLTKEGMPVEPEDKKAIFKYRGENIPPADVEKAEKLLKGRDATDWQRKMLDELYGLMKEYPAIANRIGFTNFFADFTLQHEGVARGLDLMTWDDVSNMIEHFKLIKGRLQGPEIMKKYWYYFPEFLGDIASKYDLEMYEKLTAPAKIGGKMGLYNIRAPMSTIGWTREFLISGYNVESNLKSLLKEISAEKFLWKNQIKEWRTFLDIAVRYRERNLGEEELKRWEEVKPQFEKELQKGKNWKVQEEGIWKDVDAQDIVDYFNNGLTDFYKTVGQQLHSKDMKGNKFDFRRIDVDRDFSYRNSFLRWKKDGSFDHEYYHRNVVIPLFRGEMSKLGQMPTLEDVLRAQFEFNVDTVIDNLGLEGKEAAKFRLDRRKPFIESTEATPEGIITLVKIPNRTAFIRVIDGDVQRGNIGERNQETYVFRTDHRRYKKDREDVDKHIKESLDSYKKNLENNDTFFQNELGDEEVIQAIYRGDEAKEVWVKKLMDSKEREFERFLGAAISGDLGALEATGEALINKPSAVRDLENLAIRSVPSLAKSRGKKAMPGWSTDYDSIIERYHDSIITAIIRNVYGYGIQKEVNRFLKRAPMDEHTESWADLMRIYARDSMGLPTLFPKRIIGVDKEEYTEALKKERELKRQIKKAKNNREKIELGKLQAEYEHTVELYNAGYTPERMKLKGTAFYLTSDQVMSKMLDNISKKFFGGNLPFHGKLPKDPDARRNVLIRTMHSLGNLEAKWSLMTLLTHPRTPMGNWLGGSHYNITSTGMRHFKNAYSLKYLVNHVFNGVKIRGEKVQSWHHINRISEEVLGAVESYYVNEAAMTPGFKKADAASFLSAYVGLISKNPEASTKNIYELAQKYGLTKHFVDMAAWWMRYPERKLRRTAALSHYMQAREALGKFVDDIPWDSPWLIHIARKGVEGTQFLYHSAARPAFSRTALGKILTRFQPFAWNSVRMRRKVYQMAKIYGFKQGTRDFDRLKRLVILDMFMMALAQVFVASIFDSALPPPLSWLQDSADLLFGDEKEREMAFFSSYPSKVFAPLQPVTAPILRYPLNTITALINGDWDRFASYQIWSWWPFGRMLRSGYKTVFDKPQMAFEYWFGFDPTKRLPRLMKRSQTNIENRMEQLSPITAGKKRSKEDPNMVTIPPSTPQISPNKGILYPPFTP